MDGPLFSTVCLFPQIELDSFICIDNRHLENTGYAEYNLVSEAGLLERTNFLVYMITAAPAFLIDYLSCVVVMPWGDSRMFLCEHLSQTCAYITSSHEPIAF